MEIHGRLEVLPKAEHSYHVEGCILQEGRSVIILTCLMARQIIQYAGGVTSSAFTGQCKLYEAGVHQMVCPPVGWVSG